MTEGYEEMQHVAKKAVKALVILAVCLIIWLAGNVSGIRYARQAAAWSAQEQERYQAILAKADRVNLLSERYYDGCLLARNRYMVDLATHLIAVYDGQKGGTKYTVDYAKKKGLFVSIIDPMDDRNDTTWQGYQD